jgi:hypothetical protein
MGGAVGSVNEFGDYEEESDGEWDSDADTIDCGPFENMGSWWFIKSSITEGPFDTASHAQKTIDMQYLPSANATV